jgi:hypothetical protein
MGHRILFVMLHPGFVRYYEDALHALAGAGYDVHVAFEVSRTKLGEDVTAQRLAASSPRITCGTTPERSESVREFLVRADRTAVRAGDDGAPRTRADAWESLATTVRLLADYLRFFEPAFDQATPLRARVEKRLPRVYTRLVRAFGWSRASRAVLAALLRGLERVIPTAPGIEAFLREQQPDLLLVTPLIELGSQQVDYVKAARALGIRSALCVASWDNLTSKGLVRVLPDHVVVWNEAQKREAMSLHGVPAERVLVTGAQLFDRWFTTRPSRSREEFCRQTGLDPARPFLLYVGSSMFIAPDEVPFAERWLATLRGADDPMVAGVGALIRPHPANARQWRTFDLAAFGNASVWPPIGTDPTSPGFKEDFFDSIYHSAGVVGINTSAQLEASIIGRPVFTVRSPEFAHAQEGTLHFRHLVRDGGVVQVAETLDEHVRQVGAFAGTADAWSARNRAFVERFIRPHGLDTPATPHFVDAVTRLRSDTPPRPRPDALWVKVLRAPALLCAYAARSLADGRPLWVYAMRPVVTAGVWTAAVPYGVGHGWEAHVRPAMKRMRRGVWTAWYESWRGVGQQAHRARKRLLRAMHDARVAARRATGSARPKGGQSDSDLARRSQRGSKAEPRQ